MSACVAPLFSQRPDIHQWLHHYTQLGVNKFYMYVPTLHYHEAHFDAPHEVRSCWARLARQQVRPSPPLQSTDCLSRFRSHAEGWHLQFSLM